MESSKSMLTNGILAKVSIQNLYSLSDFPPAEAIEKKKKIYLSNNLGMSEYVRSKPREGSENYQPHDC